MGKKVHGDEQSRQTLNPKPVRAISDNPVGADRSKQDRGALPSSLKTVWQEKRFAEHGRQSLDETKQVRELISQLGLTEQRKRNRLSKKLHEDIQQLIAAARMQLSCVKCDDSIENKNHIHNAETILLQALDAMNLVTHELCPPVLHEGGLAGGLEWFAERMRDKNFYVYLDLEKFAEPADEDMRLLLFECACELLFNAARHSGVNEAKLILKRASNRRIRLTVSDKGNGFDPKLLNRRKVNEKTFDLFAMRQRLEHVGGKMTVRTSADRGAEFTIIAPGACSTVLFCDDHATVREVFVRQLNRSEAGVKVIAQASDAKTAIRLAAELVPDIVIMDVTLRGDMNGIEATRQITAANPRTKVIGLSMHDDVSISTAMLQAGAVSYVNKSGELDDLIKAIKAVSMDTPSLDG